ncbi:MAG: hypothetical protein V4478_03365 [Patescibacteria group bacterium]
MKNLKKFLAILSILTVFLASGLGGILNAPAINAATSPIPVPVALFETSLASGITSSATSMTLVSGLTKDGTTLNGTYAFIIDEGTANEEFVNTDCLNKACTAMTRGLSVVTGTTSVAALTHEHRRGASVKITDSPQLLILSRILNGNSTIPNPLSYTSGTGPVSGSDLTDKEYVLSVVNGGPVTYNQVIVAGTAGETVSAGNLLYLKTSDGRWYKTSASTASTLQSAQLAIAEGAGTLGNAITNGVLINGVDTNNTGTAGALAYASNTSGAISGTTGTTERVIGQYIVSSGGLYFNPNFYYTLTKDQKDAIAGGGTLGTPSTSNKFLTQSYLTSGALTRFGGTGADGALNVTSGTTTINLGGSATVIKNYTSINVSAGATLAFSNPHANGTIIELKSQGAVTIAGTVDASGMGAASTNTGTGVLDGTATGGQSATSIANGAAGVAFSTLSKNLYTKSSIQYIRKSVILYAGSGGGNGAQSSSGGTPSGTPGVGGFGGGAVYVECAGSLTFTGTINVSGKNGSAGAGQGSAGGGGSAGSLVILANTISTNSGTVTALGGDGGANAGGAGNPSFAGGSGGGAGGYNGAGGLNDVSINPGSGGAGRGYNNSSSSAFSGGGNDTTAGYIGLNTDFF